jgi:hypothetical protein
MADRMMLIQDARLLGGSPPLCQNKFMVDENWDLGNAFLWVSNFAKSQPGGRLERLFILCHGIYAWEENAYHKASITVGGYGLLLCKQNLTLSTIGVVATNIRNLVGEIVIYACGTGSSQSNNKGKAGDGDLLCKTLAKQTKAAVVASDRIQWYQMKGANNEIDFGDWEGTVSRYNPEGGRFTVLGNPAPTRN